MLFDYPPSTRFGRVLPKSKIYEHATPKPAIRRTLIDQIDKIIWRNKLSPDTLNLAASRSVPEIQILELHPKDTLSAENIDEGVLRCIDNAIPFPLIFEIRDTEGWRVKAAIKARDEGKHSVQSEYFCSQCYAPDTVRLPLPVALNMHALYERLLQPLLPWPLRPRETLMQGAERFTAIAALLRRIGRCERLLSREPQYNRRVEFNADLRELQHQLQHLLNE